MNTKKIQRLIADKKSKLTDTELFGSASYRSYLQSIADNISGKYGRGAYMIFLFYHKQVNILYPCYELNTNIFFGPV